MGERGEGIHTISTACAIHTGGLKDHSYDSVCAHACVHVSIQVCVYECT